MKREANGRERPRRSPAGMRGAATELVGRRRERRWLHQCLDEAIAGEPRVVVLRGGAGIGKSRLAQELARHAATRGVDVHVGRCQEGASLPYLPFRTSLFPELRALLAADAEHAEGATLVGGELVQRVLGGEPGPGSAFDFLDEPDGARRERTKLLLDLTGLTLRLAEQRPLLLVIDDLHGIDEASFDLVLQLGSRLVDAGLREPVRVMLVLALRPELEASLPGDLDRLEREAGYSTLELQGFDPFETADFLARLRGTRVDAEVAASVCRVTGGNPLHLETAAAGMAPGASGRRPGGDGGDPRGRRGRDLPGHRAACGAGRGRHAAPADRRVPARPAAHPGAPPGDDRPRGGRLRHLPRGRRAPRDRRPRRGRPRLPLAPLRGALPRGGSGRGAPAPPRGHRPGARGGRRRRRAGRARARRPLDRGGPRGRSDPGLSARGGGGRPGGPAVRLGRGGALLPRRPRGRRAQPRAAGGRRAGRPALRGGPVLRPLRRGGLGDRAARPGRRTDGAPRGRGRAGAGPDRPGALLPHPGLLGGLPRERRRAPGGDRPARVPPRRHRGDRPGPARQRARDGGPGPLPRRRPLRRGPGGGGPGDGPGQGDGLPLRPGAGRRLPRPGGPAPARPAFLPRDARPRLGGGPGLRQPGPPPRGVQPAAPRPVLARPPRRGRDRGARGERPRRPDQRPRPQPHAEGRARDHRPRRAASSPTRSATPSMRGPCSA